MRPDRDALYNFLARLFFLWVIFQYALGGWDTGWLIFTKVGWPAWIAFASVTALVLYHSDYRQDVPLFIAAYALGYWGEWWGTTRGVWTYSNGQTPPDYLPPLWAIGLLTVTHLRALFTQISLARRKQADASDNISHTLIPSDPHPGFKWPKVALLVALPPLAIAVSAKQLAAVDWSGRLDAHVAAGIVCAIVLIAYRFELAETFELFICGIILGGTYEWLGTNIGEWTYITHETPPLWIIPLWGLACVAMVKLSRIMKRSFSKIA